MSEQSLAIRQAIGVEKLGEIMFKSGYWADTRSQAQAIVKILAGAELDIGPIASMNGVYIIEGKTSLSATLVGARIQASERYRYRVVEHDDKHCTIDFFEVQGGKREKLGTSSFAEADAKAAGLLERKGSMWAKYPRNMYFSRALTNGARWYTPDVFSGPIYTPDELGAEIDESGNAIAVYEPPPAPAERALPTRERDPGDASPNRMITSEDDRVWKRWMAVRTEALKYGVVPPNLQLPIGFQQLVSTGNMVVAQTQDRKDTLAEEDDARAAGGQPMQSMPDAWAENRQLMEQAYAAGLRLRELPSATPIAEVEVRNDEIRQALEQQAT